MSYLFKIPVTYKVFEFAYVEAETLDEAIDFVKEKEDFVEFVTDIVEAYSKRSYKDKVSMLKLAKDVAGNNRDYDKGKRTLIKPTNDAATINVSNIMDEVSVSDTNGR